MAYDLEEQEQLDAFKAWWNKNGNLLMALVAAVIVAYVAYVAWQSYLNKQSLAASNAYTALTAINPTDSKAIQTATADIVKNYASTPYAGRASLIAARINHDTKNNKAAKTQLEWAAKNAKEDAVRAMAILQLAAVQMEESAYQEALKTLNMPHDKAFDGLVSDLQGDIFVALGKKAEAKAAYQKAMLSLDPRGQYQSFTKTKLESLG